MTYKNYEDLCEAINLVRDAEREPNNKGLVHKALLHAEVELRRVKASTERPKRPEPPKETWTLIDE